jgi:hypothetical protein
MGLKICFGAWKENKKKYRKAKAFFLVGVKAKEELYDYSQ